MKNTVDKKKKGTSGSKMWSWKENVVNMKLNTVSKEKQTVQGKVAMGTLMTSVFLKSWWHHWYQDMIVDTNVNTIFVLLFNWWFLNKRCYWPVSNICFQIDYFSILKQSVLLVCVAFHNNPMSRINSIISSYDLFSFLKQHCVTILP